MVFQCMLVWAEIRKKVDERSDYKQNNGNYES